jgi:ABC-2 type transport system ATP-binding protein
MRSIVGVQRIAGGSVEVLGLPAGDASLRARVGYMTQALAVYHDLTVLENLSYFGELTRVTRKRVRDVLDMVDLVEFAKRPVQALSGGQQIRVSLAAALLADPEVLVLDEPTVGLDPLLRRRLWRLFHDLVAGGRTLIVSSHVMEEASRCDSILLLRDGELLMADSPQALLARTGTEDLETAFVTLIEEPATK